MGVLVISFGSQYSSLIVKRVREAEVFSKIVDWNNPKLDVELENCRAIILSGGPSSVKEETEEEIELLKKILRLKKPILGICYGMQLIHKHLGGKLDFGNHSEFGKTPATIITDHPIVDGIPHQFETWMSHNDSVIELAPDFMSVAKTKNAHTIAVDDVRKIYTVQFHPEVEHCKCGERIILNFLFLVCKLQRSWKMEDVANQKIEELRNNIGRNPVLLALSGGVDSAVVAKLLQKACANVSLIYIDTGLTKKCQYDLAMEYFKSEFKNRLTILDKSDEFIGALRGVTDPEEKRRIIGKSFEKVFEECLKNNQNMKYLAQGTIQSDLIESGKHHKSSVIKTHHNTIESLRKNFVLVEPLSDLFKSEVRKLGRTLGLPDFITNAQPVPGPAYAIRISGEVTREKLDLIMNVDNIFIRKLKEAGLYSMCSQVFSVLLNTKSTGVIGDQRKFGNVVVLRAISSRDFMTAECIRFPWDLLTEISNEIINKIPEVTRVLYDLTSKPPATIEWE